MAAPYAIDSAIAPDDLLNYCTKYLARGAKLFTESVAPDSANLTVVSESWRFPIVLPVAQTSASDQPMNQVVFLFFAPEEPIQSLNVVGSFAPLYQSFPLTPVPYDGKNSGYYYYSVLLPTGKGYYYRFIKNGADILDPVNPQTKTFRNNEVWSFFFTDYYNYSQEFEEWELNILHRLVQQIVPFRTAEAQNFINRFYLGLAKPDKLAMPIYKLDDSVGEINFITNILARQERHHLQDYKICINLIDQVLRQRNPFVNSWQVSEELIIDLYNEMASGTVTGWDYSQYGDTNYFLGLIRRHTITGAFSHPKYGGNIGGAGWRYLQDRYSLFDPATALVTGSDFNWQLAQEKPLGTNPTYKG